MYETYRIIFGRDRKSINPSKWYHLSNYRWYRKLMGFTLEAYAVDYCLYVLENPPADSGVEFENLKSQALYLYKEDDKTFCAIKTDKRQLEKHDVTHLLLNLPDSADNISPEVTTSIKKQFVSRKTEWIQTALVEPNWAEYYWMLRPFAKTAFFIRGKTRDFSNWLHKVPANLRGYRVIRQSYQVELCIQEPADNLVQPHTIYVYQVGNTLKYRTLQENFLKDKIVTRDLSNDSELDHSDDVAALIQTADTTEDNSPETLIKKIITETPAGQKPTIPHEKLKEITQFVSGITQKNKDTHEVVSVVKNPYTHNRVDDFERGSDHVAIGLNSAISVAFFLMTFVDTFAILANPMYAATAFMAQGLIRVFFNNSELINANNRSLNKWLKTAVNDAFFALGLAAIILLNIGYYILAVTMLPFITLSFSGIRSLQNFVYCVANGLMWALHIGNALEHERYRIQFFKRGIQFIGNATTFIFSALIITGKITLSAITAPIVLTIAVVAATATLYTTLREYQPFRNIFLLRWIFKDVEKQMAEMNSETLAQKITRFKTPLTVPTPPNTPENLTITSRFSSSTLLQQDSTSRQSLLRDGASSSPGKWIDRHWKFFKEWLSPQPTKKSFLHLGGLLDELRCISDYTAGSIDSEAQPQLSNKSPQEQKQLTAMMLVLNTIDEKLQMLNPETVNIHTQTSTSSSDPLHHYKNELLLCLHSLVLTGKGTLVIGDKNHTFDTLLNLEKFLQEHSDIRRDCFRAFFRKVSNVEAIYRAVERYFELFPTPIKDAEEIINEMNGIPAPPSDDASSGSLTSNNSKVGLNISSPPSPKSEHSGTTPNNADQIPLVDSKSRQSYTHSDNPIIISLKGEGGLVILSPKATDKIAKLRENQRDRFFKSTYCSEKNIVLKSDLYSGITVST